MTIYQEYAEFRQQEDDMVLFGGELELQDIKRAVTKSGEALSASQMQTPFVIVPVSRQDFRMLSDPLFLQLLACFGVKVNTAGQAYPRVDSTVNKE